MNTHPYLDAMTLYHRAVARGHWAEAERYARQAIEHSPCNEELVGINGWNERLRAAQIQQKGFFGRLRMSLEGR